MARLKTIAALLGLGTALAACNGTGQSYGVEPNRSLYSENQPVVQRTDYVIDLNAQGGGLASGERARLDAWFYSLGLGYGDRISVDDGYGADSARDDVARVAADYGLLLSEGAPMIAGEVQPGTVRVIVSRSSAHVPNCPNWEQVGGPSSTSSNYGCAVNSNVAAMIADPNDLVLGQAGSAAGRSDAGTKAIKVYREAEPTGTKGLKKEKSGG